ncbi:unnamed protein product [Brassicogethes aeneus]|uniref:Thymidylate kinase n=1 Tax=Brassicogethes aeneus TaxID=1431903 RepID=A0A9P0BLI3_BRAAE|nr:unnamed protein product [Brassicogethes aeneus]
MKQIVKMIVKRGALIVVEGVDRSGKSTQCKKLVETLKEKGLNVKGFNFPDRTTAIGKVIDEYLKESTSLSDEVIHLLFTANRWEKMHEIKKSLTEGTTWIIDRYTYSGIVFSSIKKNMSLEWCKMPESGLPKPDLTFLLMVDDEALSQRPGFGNERYEKSEIQKKVKEMFSDMCTKEDTWKLVDANKPIKDVHDSMLQDILKVIEGVKNRDLQYFDFINNRESQ